MKNTKTIHRGSSSVNKILSEARAKVVSKGIQKSLLVPIGNGKINCTDDVVCL